MRQLKLSALLIIALLLLSGCMPLNGLIGTEAPEPSAPTVTAVVASATPSGATQTSEIPPTQPSIATTAPSPLVVPTETPSPKLIDATATFPVVSAVEQLGNALVVDKLYSGAIAEGSYLDSTFEGSKNIPLLFTIKRVSDVGKLRYRIRIFDPEGTNQAQEGVVFDNEPVILPFTPTMDGSYTLRLEGYAGYGNVEATLSYLPGSPSA